MASRTEENQTGSGLVGQVNLRLGPAVVEQDHAAVVAGGLARRLHRRGLRHDVVVLAAAGEPGEREQADGQQGKRAPHSSFLPNRRPARPSGTAIQSTMTGSRTAWPKAASALTPAMPESAPTVSEPASVNMR